MNQKWSPEIDYTPISGSSYVRQLCYCGLYIGNSTLRVMEYDLLAGYLLLLVVVIANDAFFQIHEDQQR